MNQFIRNSHVDGIDELNRDGFLKVDDFGLEIDVLTGLADRSSDLFKAEETMFNKNHDAWVSVTSNGTVSTARLSLPELEPFITNKNFQEILKNYLGTSIKLDGYKLTKLNPAATSDMEKSYVASRWHHDRTGRRVKLLSSFMTLTVKKGIQLRWPLEHTILCTTERRHYPSQDILRNLC